MAFDCSVQPKVSINLTVMILAATGFSTLASVGGGLMMYFESTAALEDTIAEVSRAECNSLQIEIMKSIEETEDAVYRMYRFFNTSLIKSRDIIAQDANGHLTVAEDDVATWVELLRHHTFSSVRESKHLYSISMAVLAPNESDWSSIHTSHWYDLKADGGREYAWATSGKHLPAARYGHRTDTVVSSVDEFGNTVAYLYQWDVLEAYYVAPIQNGSRTGWTSDSRGALVHRWRDPSTWYASDGNPYVYASFDLVFPTPPPPHPWSAYKDITVSGFFMFTSWEAVVATYGKTHADTEVVVLDPHFLLVYATSSNHSMIDKACVAYYGVQNPPKEACIVTIAHMTQRVQDAWEKTKDKEEVFTMATLDGEEYFIRKKHIFRFVPSYGGRGLDTTILWIRPVSTIEAQVRHALYLLAGFSAAVLLLDAVLATLEVLLVGLPLGRLSEAMQSLQCMELEEALVATNKACTRGVAVTQVQNLVNGMLFSITSLGEYKTFLPGALFEGKSVLGEGNTRRMRAPPGQENGEATVVFTDIRSSTSIWEAVPEGMCEALQIHNAVMRDTMDEFDGYEVKTIGDAFMVAFDTTLQGVEFGLRVHERLHVADWPPSLLECHLCTDASTLWRGLTVRIGVNSGPVSVEMNTLTGRTDYFGHTVNVASRLESTCTPGAVAICALLWDAEGGPCGVIRGATKQLQLKGVTCETSVCHLLPESLGGRDTNPLISLEDNFDVVSVSPLSSAASATSVTSTRTVLSASGCVATVGVVVASVPDEGHLSSLRSMSTVLLTLTAALDRSGGRLVSLMGSFVCIGWNLTHAAPAHIENALRFAQHLRSMPALQGGGIVSGPVHHGEVGARNHRFVTVMGRAVRRSWRLCEDAIADGSFFLYEPPVETSLPPNLRKVLTPHTKDGVYVVSGELSEALIHAPSRTMSFVSFGQKSLLTE